MSPIIKSNWSFISILGACIITLALIVVRAPFSPDSYLHLGIGRYVLTRHTIPSHQDISYKEAQPSLEWISHSWLFDLIAYLSYGADAVIGPTGLLIALFTLSLGILLQILKIEHIPSQLSLCLATFVTLICVTFWRVHPLTVATPLFLATIWVSTLWRRQHPYAIFFLPVITLLFANLAGGYLIILALLIAIPSLFELIVHPLLLKANGHNPTRTHKQHKQLLIALVATGMASLISPYGFRLYLYGVTGYALLGSAKWYSTLAGALDVTNTSIFKTSLSPAYYVLFLLYFLATIGLLIVSLVRDRQFFLTRIVAWLPLLAVFWFGFFFIRFIPFATFCTIPLIAILLARHWEKFRGNRRVTSTMQRYCPIILIGVFGFWLARTPTQIVFHVATEQCDLIRTHHIPPNILLSTELTGYMYSCLFPQKQQIDARDDFFDANDTIGVYGQLTTITADNLKTLLEHNEINVVLTSKENDYLSSFFNKNPEWSLIYLDSNGLLFVKENPTLTTQLEALKFRYVDLTRNLGFDPKEIKPAIKEMEAFHERYPQNILATGQLATLYRFDGQLKKAEETLATIIETKPHFVLDSEMGRIKAAQADCTGAEHYFLRALADRGEQNVSKTVLDVAILYAGCFQDMKQAKHYLDRYLSYPLPETERERASAIAKKFNIILTP